MKCFRHHTEDAVGICKSCGKGLCHKCAAELTDGIACKDSCETRVNLINKTLDNNQRVVSVTNKQMKNMAFVGVVLGLLFAILGIVLLQTSTVNGSIFIIIGIVITVSGILRLTKKAQYPVISADNKEHHHKK